MVGQPNIKDILYSINWNSVKKTTKRKEFGQFVAGSLEHKQAKKKKRRAEKRAKSLKNLKDLYPAEKN